MTSMSPKDRKYKNIQIVHTSFYIDFIQIKIWKIFVNNNNDRVTGRSKFLMCI